MRSKEKSVQRSSTRRLGPRPALLVLTGIVLIASGRPLAAQTAESYTARLASAPNFGIPREAVAGIGSASAELRGAELIIAGSFQELASPATRARVYIGPVLGVRGDPVFDLTIVKGSKNGTYGGLTGRFELNAEQIAALRDGRVHIQVHSEGAPNGHLLGWFLR